MKFLKKFKKTITVLVVTSVLTAMYVASVYGNSYVFFMGHTLINKDEYVWDDNIRTTDTNTHDVRLGSIDVKREGRIYVLSYRNIWFGWRSGKQIGTSYTKSNPNRYVTCRFTDRPEGRYRYVIAGYDMNGRTSNASVVFNNAYFTAR